MAISVEAIAVYAVELARLTREQLDRAVERTIQEWDKSSQMPTIPFIKARSGAGAKLHAEQAWELAWKLIKRDWYSDGIGWLGDAAKKLSPAMQYAIRQCGGEYKMAYSDEEVFPFMRRDFLLAHERFESEGGEQIRLTQGEATKLLDQIRREELPE